MISCFLCLENKSDLIKMCSKKGRDLKCSSIIGQHFWLKPSNKKNSEDSICLTCWDVLLAFHQLYQLVAKAHNYFDCEVSTNPFLLEQEVKRELNSLELPLKIQEIIDEENQIILSTEKNKENSSPLHQADVLSTNHQNINYTDDESEAEIPLSILKLNNLQKTEESFHRDLPSNTDFKKLGTKQTSVENGFDSTFSQCSSDNESDGESDSESNNEITDDNNLVKNKASTKSTKNYDNNIAKLFEKLECLKCKFPVQKFDDLTEHFRIEHNSEPAVICCGRKFQKPKTLSKHVLIHLNPSHLKCTECGRIYENSSALKKHIKTHHQCDQCLENFSNKKTLQNHLIKRHLTKLTLKFACCKCDSKFVTRRKLRAHERSAHGVKGNVICDQCGAHLSSRKSLREHMRKHLDLPNLPSDPVQCDICGKWLKHQNTLRQHKNWVHERRINQQCPICNQISTSRRALEMHIYRIHKIKREFPCTMCEKVLKTDRELKEHINVHTKEKQFVCEICSKAFNRKGSMLKHVKRYHTGLKEEMKCDICNIWVASKSNLKTHMKVMHEKSDIKHPCPICGKVSVHELALKRHIRRNHGKKAIQSTSEPHCVVQS